MREQIKFLFVKLNKKKKKKKGNPRFRQDGKNFEILLSSKLFRDEITIVKRWRCDRWPFFVRTNRVLVG